MESTAISAASLVDDACIISGSERRALRMASRSLMWRGNREERREKFTAATASISAALGMEKPPKIVFGVNDDSDSSNSGVRGDRSGGLRIKIVGRLSVVTLLWCLATAAGKPEAMKWAVNAFRAAWPRSFARCDLSGPFVRNVQRLSSAA